MDAINETLESVFAKELEHGNQSGGWSILVRTRMLVVEKRPTGLHLRKEQNETDPQSALDSYLSLMLHSQSSTMTNILILDCVPILGQPRDTAAERSLSALSLSKTSMAMLGMNPAYVAFPTCGADRDSMTQAFVFGMTSWSISWSVTASTSYAVVLLSRKTDQNYNLNTKYDLQVEDLGVLERTLASMRSFAHHPCYIGFCVACAAIVRLSLLLQSNHASQVTMDIILRRCFRETDSTFETDLPAKSETIDERLSWTSKHSDALRVVGLLLSTIQRQLTNYELSSASAARPNQEATNKTIREAIDALEQKLVSLQLFADSLKDRAKTQSARVLTLIARKDQKIAIQISEYSRRIASETKRDSESMKTLAIVTMIFLPGTFLAALFATPMFRWSDIDGSLQVSQDMWIYWAVTVPLTILVISMWTVWIWFKNTQEEQVRLRLAQWLSP